MDMNLSKFWEKETRKPGVLKSMGSQIVGHDLATEHTQNYWDTYYIYIYIYIYIYFFFFLNFTKCV